MTGSHFISDVKTYARWKSLVNRCVHTDRRLPSQVFVESFGHFRFEEIDWLMSSDGWAWLQSMCRRSGDEQLLMGVIEPDPETYFHAAFGVYSWIELSPDMSDEGYSNARWLAPKESHTDHMQYMARSLVWVPASGQWVVWGDRDYEVCVLASRDSGLASEWHDVEWAVDVPLAMSLRIRPGQVDLPPAVAQFRKNFGHIREGR